jgi:outer membrane lipoprotein-sorting protein
MKEMTVSSTIWAEKEKVKMEQNVQGRKFVMYFDGEDMYQYDPASNTAMKFPTKGMDKKGPEKPDPSGYSDHMAPNSLKIIENTVYDGVKCRVISYTMKDEDGTVKMWVREDYGMPMRMEMTTKDGNKITTENKNMKIGALPADTFKLPAGAKIQDMGEMMKKLPPKQ